MRTQILPDARYSFFVLFLFFSQAFETPYSLHLGIH